MSQGGQPRTVQAVQTAIDIIELLQDRERAGVTELATELDRSKGTVHTHLSTLLQNEYVVKEGDEYRLSLRPLDLGETVKRRLGIYDVVVDEIDDLAAECGELAQFATEEHGRVVYLYKSKGENAVESASSVGKREYAHAISLGKAILSQFPDERVHDIVDRHGLHQYTRQTITSRDRLLEELDEIRERGYAEDREERIEGLKCVSAPVNGPDGEVLGAVSISGPSSRMTGERFTDELPSMVVRSANIIEINAQFS